MRMCHMNQRRLTPDARDAVILLASTGYQTAPSTANKAVLGITD